VVFSYSLIVTNVVFLPAPVYCNGHIVIYSKLYRCVYSLSPVVSFGTLGKRVFAYPVVA